MRTWTARLGMMLGIALMVGLVAACGGGTKEDAAAPAAKTEGAAATAGGKIAVTLAEWSVKPSAAKIGAGSVTFDVSNKGATAHELLIVQTDLAADKLPQANGAVDEKQVTVVGRTASLDGGKTESKTVELKAGKYVLLCNLPAHYGQGMHTAFTVQ
jgi:uncharacterized cupredoxin-like copper-binding protein